MSEQAQPNYDHWQGRRIRHIPSGKILTVYDVRADAGYLCFAKYSSGGKIIYTGTMDFDDITLADWELVEK